LASQIRSIDVLVTKKWKFQNAAIPMIGEIWERRCSQERQRSREYSAAFMLIGFVGLRLGAQARGSP
jgi:hypothetical protein